MSATIPTAVGRTGSADPTADGPDDITELVNGIFGERRGVRRLAQMSGSHHETVVNVLAALTERGAIVLHRPPERAIVGTVPRFAR